MCCVVYENNFKNYSYVSYDDGYFEERKFNDNGQVVYYRDTHDVYTYDYDDNGNLISRYMNDDIDSIYEYDENNNRIYYCNIGFFDNGNNYEAWYEYDDNGKCIHSYDSEGQETWFEYDNNNYQINCYSIYDSDDILIIQ